MRRRITWLVLLAIFASPAGGAAAQDVSADDRFELFNQCRPMRFIVKDLHADAAEIDLTEAAIQAAVESRLRSARLYDADAGPVLYLNVELVVGLLLSLRLEYMKALYDPVSEDSRLVPTWQSTSIGTQGGDAAYLLSILAGQMDGFLVEYLRVNESACD